MAIPQNLISLYETRTMLPFIELNPGAPTPLRDAVFTNTRLFDSKKIDIEVIKRGREVPNYCKSIESGDLVEHEGYNSFTYEAPYVHEYLHIKPEDFDFKQIGETPYNYTPPEQQVTNRLNRDYTTLDTRYNRLEERQAVELITTGALTPYDKKGNAFPTIDFGVQTSHKPVLTGTAKWNDASATKNSIIAQLVLWNTDLLVKDGTHNVRQIWMGRAAKNALINALDPDNSYAGFNSIDASRGSLDLTPLPEGISRVGRLRELGDIPMFCYVGWYKDRTGTVVQMFPENLVVMVGSGRYDRNYGRIENFNAPSKIARFPWIWRDPKGKGIETHLETSPLLSIYEPDDLVIATVC
ncbi:minor capsid protein E [Spirochaetia bacterium]|nr:minor capsid protein E [Spirochaetia bacterium]